MATIKGVVDFTSLKPITVSSVATGRECFAFRGKPIQKKTKRVVNSTKQVGIAKPVSCEQLISTIFSEEKKKEQRMYLLALENARLRKQALAIKKILCMMCAMKCDSEEELKLHEQKVHWKEDEASYYCLTEHGERIKAPYICLTCGGGYPTSTRLKSHLHEAHNLRFEF